MIVVAEGRIEYQGETTSMSKLAQQLLKSKNPLQGSQYFSYEGELLTKRRYRLEDESKIPKYKTVKATKKQKKVNRDQR